MRSLTCEVTGFVRPLTVVGIIATNRCGTSLRETYRREVVASSSPSPWLMPSVISIRRLVVYYRFPQKKFQMHQCIVHDRAQCTVCKHTLCTVVHNALLHVQFIVCINALCTTVHNPLVHEVSFVKSHSQYHRSSPLPSLSALCIMALHGVALYFGA